ncbi:chlorohydrolase family protein [Agromyces sp. SYSU K20354]|uniref:chlorohydrolase family protein n=1 Tax=Agromyces cavernae TaxID=2898659 RepID=UPI001E3346FA|nr:chlorohydrolase family protein [Agromyces cavernae]MCD2443383.1 chlorohydrolase family protein [Agromyces cavernae]
MTSHGPRERSQHSTLITADHVIAHDGDAFVEIRDGAVVVEDGCFTFVGDRADAPAGSVERIDLGESVLLPGLIDLDALADIDHLVLDAWGDAATQRRLMWSAAYFRDGRHDVLTADERSTMRRYALTQLALHGITTFVPIASEVHSEWAETHDDLVDVARIASELGLRSFLGPSYRSGVHVVGADGSTELAWDDERGRAGLAEAVRFLDTVASLDDPLVTGILAPCRIETVREEVLRATARVSAERGVLVRAHALQELGERELVAELHGTTQLGLLDRVGLLNDRLILAHGVYLDLHPEIHGEDRGELAALAASGASIIHCPLTNNRYAFLLERLSQYLEAGVNVGLGTDSFPPDLIRGIDAGVQLAKAQHDDLSRGMLAEYVEAATLGGARALHRPDLGRISVGASADLVAFALDDFRLGTIEDPLRTLILAGSARDVRFSMVGGRAVVRDGRIAGVDLEALRRDGRRTFEKLRDAYLERDYLAGRPPELFPPVFRGV